MLVKHRLGVNVAPITNLSLSVTSLFKRTCSGGGCKAILATAWQLCCNSSWQKSEGQTCSYSRNLLKFLERESNDELKLDRMKRRKNVPRGELLFV